MSHNEIVQNLCLDTEVDKWKYHRQMLPIAVSGLHVHIRMHLRSLLLLFLHVHGKVKFI